MIESLFSHDNALARHLNAPLLLEREQYLMFLLHRGMKQKAICQVAAALLNVIRVMDMSALRSVDIEEIDIAVGLWRSEATALGRSPTSEISAMNFRRAAIHWLRFHQSVRPGVPPTPPYGDTLPEYLAFVNFTLTPLTAARYFRSASLFLASTQNFQPVLSRLSTVDIERFIGSKRSVAYKPSTLSTTCVNLRNFLRFTESRGWTPPNLSKTINCPRPRRNDQQYTGPRWRDVRRLLAAGNDGIADTRARAIMSLCAIYGLRVSEVSDANLNDFDWINETFTVRRSKSHFIQRFPLQYEVGEAILRYLRNHRPKCSSRRVFVTLSTPYRKVTSQCLGGIIKDRMDRLKIQAPSVGAHSLRRSCATELLRNGISLANIADFLGHQNLASVSVYAKCSIAALREVALINLEGLL